MSARVNLLPREIEQRARARRTASFTVAGVAVFAALLGLIYITKLNALDDARDERTAAEAVVAERRAELAELEKFARLDAEVNARNQLLSAAMATEISWARVLNDLALTFPASSSLLTLDASAEGAVASGLAGAAPDPNSKSIADVTFTGYSVERYAPGVERVLLKLSDVGMFFNSYLSQAADEKRGDTRVITFNGTLQLNEEARTDRYINGLPPEAGQ